MSSRLVISSSCGAWITMVVEPRMLSRQPSFPCRFKRSVRKYDDSTALQWHLQSATYWLFDLEMCFPPAEISFREKVLMSSEYLTRTLRAPRGVTRVAGAKAYAAKLAASPAPTVKTNNVRKHPTKKQLLQQRKMLIKILWSLFVQ